MRAQYIFAGGMPRSGSTLQYNIAAELVERLGIGRREIWTDDHDSYFADRPAKAELTVFKSHVLSVSVQRLLSEGRAVAATSYRDIRDVTASWQFMIGRPLSSAQAVRFTGKAIDDFTQWESLPPESVLVSRYETLIQDIPAEISRIAELLGLSIGSEDVEAISGSVDARSMKARLRNLRPDDLDSSGSFVYDRKTLLHLNHLNGGEIGRYERELSRPVVRKLTGVHRDWLKSHGYSTSPRGGRGGWLALGK